MMTAAKPFRAIVLILLLLAPLPLEAQKPDRSKPPVLGPPPALKVAPLQRFSLSNGLPVVFMEKHEVPLVQINMIVLAGSAMDPAEKLGLGSLTAAMLDEGAGALDALQLADAIDVLGADINTSASYHSTGIMLHTPLSKLDAALPLLADIVQRPTFPQKELDRLLKERLTTLLQWRDEPRAIASVLFDRVVFGPDHPYGRPAIGTAQTLPSITVDDLKKFHDSYFHAGNARLIVVGDITLETLRPKLEEAFGSWKKGTPAQQPAATARQVGATTVYVVDKPGAPQSEIRIGRIGAARSTEDYFPLVVTNTILGGSFTSRLNQNLREQHGYTYGAGSNFSFRPMPGPFLAGSAVQTAVTDKALTEFMKELTGIRAPVLEEELQRARNYIALGYPDNFSSVLRIAGQLTELVLYNLPDTYFNSYIGNINSVTVSQVQRAAEMYIDPKAMAVVVVGDRKGIEKGIADLKLGEVKFLTIEDVLGPAPVIQSD
jgi:predicted Zn-dependent peptidase